jgi:hypothetical protein
MANGGHQPEEVPMFTAVKTVARNMLSAPAALTDLVVQEVEHLNAKNQLTNQAELAVHKATISITVAADATRSLMPTLKDMSKPDHAPMFNLLLNHLLDPNGNPLTARDLL